MSDDPQIHPYEEVRLRNIMRNNEQMEQMGIRLLANVFGPPTVSSSKKSKKEGFGSEYDPDGENEEDVSTDSLVSDEDEQLVASLPASSTAHQVRTTKILLNPPVSSLLAYYLCPLIHLYI